MTTAASKESPLLEAQSLSRSFVTGRTWFGQVKQVHAVDQVNLDIKPAETLAIVGESGCGKSTLGRLLLGLLKPTTGTVRYAGRDIADLSPSSGRSLRRELQLIFQDPFSSLNPRQTIGTLIEEPLWVHGLGDAKARRARVMELLDHVGLRPEHANRYPHEFSGGQRQRVGIARALASGPRLVIGDEPVSALDVSVQAQVINILVDLKKAFGLTLVIIAHDLAVIRHMSDRIAVMYLGEIVELAENDQLFTKPFHPYTQALLAAIPSTQPGMRQPRPFLEGDPPNPLTPPDGCRFHPRCPAARSRCHTERPKLRTANDHRKVACHFWEEIDGFISKSPTETAETPARDQRFALYRAAIERHQGTATE